MLIPFDDTTKMMPSEISFRLTDNGNYDMERKIFKNASDLVDSSDLITENFILN